MEPPDRRSRSHGFATDVIAESTGSHRLPVRAQRTYDRRIHQALHIVSRRVMRAELGAVAGFQRALQKAPENSGFDDGPVAAGGAYQYLQISLAERQRHLFAKQTASERGHVLTQGGAVASARQTAEYGRRAQVKAGCMTAIAFQQRQKTLFADQTHAVGVHRQNALHHEHEDAAIRDRLKRLRWVL